jgi:thymidine phosphorylase
VESVPLITASILSKKLAAGLDALVLDVKVGSGAMMRGLPEARRLAASLVDVASGAGLPTRALITDMDRVLGLSAGNALEVQEAIDFLTGRAREPRLLELTLALAAQALHVGGVAGDLASAQRRVESALAGGGAAERFARMVAALGGPADVLQASGLAAAPVQRDVPAPRPGWVTQIDVRALGLAVVALGGGRRHGGERIDPRVGLTHLVVPGQVVAAGEPLARVHAADAASAEAVAGAVAGAFVLGDTAPPASPVVHEVVPGPDAAVRAGARQSRA